MKEYAVGYTIFEFEGTDRRPIANFKPIKGNIKDVVGTLERRIKKIKSNHALMGICAYALAYGFSVRVLLSL